MKRFLKKIRFITGKDILAIFQFIIAFPISKCIRLKHKDLWLICESEKEARDNGYWLFKYIRETYPQQDIMYAIDMQSVDYKKVASLGKVISYGGIKHWIYYLAATKNISTQKGGKPNAAVCYFLEIYGVLKNKRIFLQHGITISDAEWLYYENTKLRLFVCGAKPEYDSIVKTYGYPKGYVQYLGFCRFDKLHDIDIHPKQVVVMPSWREWLYMKTDAFYEFEESDNFTDSEYFKKWNEFLCSERLKNILEKYDLQLLFYPHRNVQQYLDRFSKGSDHIQLASWEDYDIQTLLKESACMITDYSSVCMDFGYMRKPSLYYQFDLEKFRKGQYAKGYFDYQKDGFGEVAFDLEQLLDGFERICENKLKIEDIFLDRIKNFFPIYDNVNCERNYQAIKKI